MTIKGKWENDKRPLAAFYNKESNTIPFSDLFRTFGLQSKER